MQFSPYVKSTISKPVESQFDYNPALNSKIPSYTFQEFNEKVIKSLNNSEDIQFKPHFPKISQQNSRKKVKVYSKNSKSKFFNKFSFKKID